jgi:ABC-type sugar transport system ATPase subunit
MSLILLDHVSKKFSNTQALKPTTLDIEKDSKLAIVGETGSGKSTLLKIVGGLEDPDTGAVFYNGSRVLGRSEKLIAGHPDIVYLSQHFELPKFISVLEHLHNPYEIGEDDANEIYKVCQINHLLSKGTNQLSGGEKQRVALAKVLTKIPKVLLLDEPFSNLDNIHKQIIKDVLEDVRDTWGVTMVMVSHEPQDVLPWADQIAVMKKGAVLQMDTPYAIYNKPLNEYVAGLFGKYNVIDPEEWGISSVADWTKIGNKVLARPEQFRMTSNSKEGKKGVVKQVAFYGNRFEITVKVKTNTSIVVSSNEQYAIDNQVFITLDL